MDTRGVAIYLKSSDQKSHEPTSVGWYPKSLEYFGLKIPSKMGWASTFKIYVVNSLRKLTTFLEMAITSANINRFCSYFQGLILTYISITFINKFFGSDEVEILALCSERPNLCPLMTISFLMEF